MPSMCQLPHLKYACVEVVDITVLTVHNLLTDNNET
jgi:hypothetical protein